MKIFILATGEDDKFYPLHHGPLLPILNRPLMAYTLDLVGRQGIKEIDISLYHNPGEVESYFGNGHRWGLELVYHLQNGAWKNGGALRWAINRIDETVIVFPSDILIDLDIQAAYKFHKEKGSKLTIISVQSPSINCGLSVDQLGKVNAGNGGTMHPTGVFLVEPEIISEFPFRISVDLLDDVVPHLLSTKHSVYSYEHKGYWNSLENFAAYSDAQFFLLRSLFQPLQTDTELEYIRGDGRKISSGIWVGRNSVIHPTVQLASSVYLCENCQVEKNVILGPDVIVGQNVIIDQGATLSHCIVLNNTYVGRLVNVSNKIVSKNLVIDITSGEHIQVSDKFLLDYVQTRQVEEFWRSIIDRFFAGFLLLLLSPFLIASVLLLLFDGLPVFTYVQCIRYKPGNELSLSQRPTVGFNLLRFANSKMKNRVFVFRNLIQRLGIYRLPELVNVLKGDIALVGVKPLSEIELSSLNEDWQMTRFLVAPGFTGLWYVNPANLDDFDETLVADVYYAAMHNWYVDLQILAKTPIVWFRRIFFSSAIDSFGLNNESME